MARRVQRPSARVDTVLRERELPKYSAVNRILVGLGTAGKTQFNRPYRCAARRRYMVRGMSSLRRESDLIDMHALVDSIPALIHTARPDGYLDYFNKPWL